MKLLQCLIQNDKTSKVVFLNKVDPFKKGDCITLKDGDDPNEWWEVKEIYGEVNEKDVKDSHGSSKVFDSIQKEFKK